MDHDDVRHRYLVAGSKRIKCVDSRASGDNAVGVGVNSLPPLSIVHIRME
jgi:hypothetical protein